MRNPGKRNCISILEFLFLTVFSVHIFVKTVAADNPIIFPLPQSLELTSDIFVWDEAASIIIPENPANEDLSLARCLVRELSDRYGIASRIERLADIPDNRKTVIMGDINNSLIKQYINKNNLGITGEDPGPEGYVLQVSSDKIIIAGSDSAGAFYGLQTLRQLLMTGNGVNIHGIKIRDWPNLPVRAIRMYVPGPENIPFFKRFIRDFMALYKFNKLVLELNCMRLDRHPEINAGWIEFGRALQYSRRNRPTGKRGEEKTSSHYDSGDGVILEKEDVRDLVEFANKNFIGVIPELPSLTHCYYLLARHQELAEYQGDNWPDTYCPSRPAAYELLFDVYDEYIEVMEPEMIHIGHDEWRIPMDVCPLCSGKDFSELYIEDVNKIYNYLTKKGIKVAMWGDHLLENVRNAGPREAKSSSGVTYYKPGALSPALVKDHIPRDILIFNWFWGDQENEKKLQEFGFKQFFGNFKPNISNWDERIKKIDLVGGGPSSWAATTEFNFGKDLLYDFLGCSNLLWSTHTLRLPELADRVRKLMPLVRSRLASGLVPSEDGNHIGFIDITSHFNLPVNSKDYDLDLSSFKYGKVNSNRKKFNLADNNSSSGNIAIAVGTAGTGFNPFPNEAKGIKINDDVSSLLFLHACALPSGNQKAYYNMPDFFDTADLLGWYEIVYEDGYRINVPVQYGVNIIEWNSGKKRDYDKREGETGSPQDVYCYTADPVNCSADTESNSVTFYTFEWVNPRFGKIITEINIHGTVNYQSAQPGGNPKTSPMHSNAILLAGISKVTKREIK